MASRYFFQFKGSLERSVVFLYANIPIGATGAVGTLIPGRNQGISSVTRSSQGVYVINFGHGSSVDKYHRTLALSGTEVLATNGTVATVQLGVDNASTGSITIRTLDATGAAVDPDSGCNLIIQITLKNAGIVVASND